MNEDRCGPLHSVAASFVEGFAGGDVPVDPGVGHGCKRDGSGDDGRFVSNGAIGIDRQRTHAGVHVMN